MKNNRIRIYDLSKELKLNNKDLISACVQLGILAKNYLSTITEEDADKIRAFINTKNFSFKSSDLGLNNTLQDRKNDFNEAITEKAYLAKQFENIVGELFELAGLDVFKERLFGHKKVDLYMEDRRLGSKRRVAVECKLYKRQIQQKELSVISANYHPLYESNFIDELLVVTQNGLTPSAYTMVDGSRFINHITYEELQNSVLDFRIYLSEIINAYERDGLPHYYIGVRTSENLDLETEVLDWIQSSDDYPIAILGSYGMGKTTFAKRLSYILAKEVLQDGCKNRIPILIRLGDISSEQSLDGLLGKVFTSTSVVQNYNFNLFMKLNELGRFIIILDGFDEMKHTLSWDEFRYNFRQLNRLVITGSKIILLGRPTAFVNDEEYNFALHGIKVLHNKSIREPDWPDFKEFHLSLFNREQVSDFLHRYFRYKKNLLKASQKETKSPKDKRRLDKDIRKLDKVIKDQVSRITGKQFADIARRPVQLRMLAEVLPQWDDDINLLTVSILYDYFIDLIIQREQEKITRRLFDVRERRKFARQLARWLWENNKEMSITASEIPDKIIQEYSGKSKNLEGIRRDLVSACFLDRKIGESLYFPHRSFQEFLVADSITVDLLDNRISLGTADSLITKEIAYFLEGLATMDLVKKWEYELEKYRGTLSWKFIKIWISEENYVKYLISRLEYSKSPWHPLILSVIIQKQADKSKSKNFNLPYTSRDLCKAIVHKLGVDDLTDVLYSIHCCLCISGLTNLIKSDSFFSRAIALLCQHPSQYQLVIDEHGKKRRVFQANGLIIGFISRLQNIGSDNVFDVRGLYTYFRRVLEDYCLIEDWIFGSTIKTEDLVLPNEVSLSDADASIVKEYLSEYCSQKNI